MVPGSEHRSDEAVQEVKQLAEGEDWEVKRTVGAIVEWMKGQRTKAIQNPRKLEMVNTIPCPYRSSPDPVRQLLSRLETLISLPSSTEHITTPLSGFTPRLRIRQTIFRTENGFETMRRLLGVLSGTAPVDLSATRETADDTEAGNLPVDQLTLDDADAAAHDERECYDSKQHVERILRILHTCLANHANRRHFEVSPVNAGNADLP